jgi:hypothetical protein
MDPKLDPHCDTCSLYKGINGAKAPSIKNETTHAPTATRASERLHVDLGTSKIASRHLEFYWQLTVDRRSRKLFVQILKLKSHALPAFKTWYNREKKKNPTFFSVLYVRCDQAYNTDDWRAWFASEGITPEFTAPGDKNHFQNHVAERGIGLVRFASLSMLHFGGVSFREWPYAVSAQQKPHQGAASYFYSQFCVESWHLGRQLPPN